MLGTTLCRNQPEFSNKVVAQAGYALTALVAVVETIVASVFCLISVGLYAATLKPLEQTSKWGFSSVFRLGWSVVDFCLNPCVVRLVTDEESASKILLNGNYFSIPFGAILDL